QHRVELRQRVVLVGGREFRLRHFSPPDLTGRGLFVGETLRELGRLERGGVEPLTVLPLRLERRAYQAGVPCLVRLHEKLSPGSADDETARGYCVAAVATPDGGVCR